jgi:hypothetical protein
MTRSVDFAPFNAFSRISPRFQQLFAVAHERLDVFQELFQFHAAATIAGFRRIRQKSRWALENQMGYFLLLTKQRFLFGLLTAQNRV